MMTTISKHHFPKNTYTKNIQICARGFDRGLRIDYNQFLFIYVFIYSLFIVG